MADISPVQMSGIDVGSSNQKAAAVPLEQIRFHDESCRKTSEQLAHERDLGVGVVVVQHSVSGAQRPRPLSSRVTYQYSKKLQSFIINNNDNLASLIFWKRNQSVKFVADLLTDRRVIFLLRCTKNSLKQNFLVAI